MRYVYVFKGKIHEVGEAISSLFPRGETFADSLSGKWVELSEEQVAFMDANPGASAKEWFDMELAPVVPPEPPTPPDPNTDIFDGVYSVNGMFEFLEGVMIGCNVPPDKITDTEGGGDD